MNLTSTLVHNRTPTVTDPEQGHVAHCGEVEYTQRTIEEPSLKQPKF